ncbi:Altered inheritance of mitochondria protein 32 [Candida viswanathii]|uniref:Altered inheritance of mitochondria protein 32 n=1 Tax=Candida viswanathii TaxID=5486 RepID=A0A367XVJ2_9ASCO|nr:Altered inheritance of mitochondria protein 32 [Candida viswanathii]
MLFRRFYSIKWRLQDTCPVPKYDTGCTYCKPNIPADLPINHDANLHKTAAIPTRHLFVFSRMPMNEMPSKAELVPHTISNEIIKYKKLYQTSTQRVAVSNIHLNNQESIMKSFDTREDDQLVMLYPDMKMIKFDLLHLEQFVQRYLYSEEKEAVYNPFAKTSPKSTKDTGPEISVDPANFEEFRIEKDLILTCGHTKRDLRCGILAPMIMDELGRTLKDNIEEYYIGEVSHIGGHAYAGNLLYYPKLCASDRDFIWYGRVTPESVQGIVELTVVNKTIIEDLFRGDIELYR